MLSFALSPVDEAHITQAGRLHSVFAFQINSKYDMQPSSPTSYTN